MTISGATAAKGAAGVAVPVAGIGGVYGVDKLVKSSNSKPSTVDLLFEKKPNLLYYQKDFGTNNSDYKKDGDTFGYAYGRFMRDPKEDDATWDVKNKSIKGSDHLNSSEFKAVKDGNKKLKETCEEFYKKKKSEITQAQGFDVWAWCSPISAEPKKISHSSVSKNGLKWGNDSENGQALMDFDEDDLSWEIILNNFLKRDLTNRDKNKNIHAKFKSVTKEEELKKVCEEAYKSEKVTGESNYGKNAIEYCVLDQSIKITGYPKEPAAT